MKSKTKGNMRKTCRWTHKCTILMLEVTGLDEVDE